MIMFKDVGVDPVPNYTRDIKQGIARRDAYVSVPDPDALAFAIAGTPEECVAQIRRAMAAGARQFITTSFLPDPRAFMRRWAKEVAGALPT